VQPATGIKGFATRPLGRAALIAVAIVTLGVGVIYLGPLLGVAILLLFGLALPIYLGWRRPRSLAIAGLVILLLAAPLAAVLATEQYYQPSPAASSPGGLGETNGSFLQNGVVAPFSSTNGRVFTFSVTVSPSHLNTSWHLVNLTLFVSTCPDATTPNDSASSCPVPYPSFTQVHPFNGTPTGETTVTFTQRLPAPNLYWWIVYATCNFTTRPAGGGNGTGHWGYIWLQATSGYVDVQGPVVGDFLSILGIVILPVYELVLVYPGLIFYVALLVYTYYKARQARRSGPVGPPPGAPGSAPAPPSGPPISGAAPATPGAPREELHCPKCGAVVYPNESQCWKCGTPLGAGGDAPLPSGPGGPSGPAPPP
jgi:hypothetical protein